MTMSPGSRPNPIRYQIGPKQAEQQDCKTKDYEKACHRYARAPSTGRAWLIARPASLIIVNDIL
jgi:hypothetical protein